MKAAAAALCGDIFTDLEATRKIIVEFALTKLPEILISPMQNKSKWGVFSRFEVKNMNE